VAVVGHVGGGGRAAGEEAAVLGDIGRGAVHVVFAAAQLVARRVGDRYAVGDADDVVRYAERIAARAAAIVDRSEDVVGRAGVAEVGILGDITDAVIAARFRPP